MKKNKYYHLIDREPWYKNHPSPMAKWLHNLTYIGFYCFGKNIGFLWLLFFNPMMVIFYIVVLFMIFIHLQC